MTRDTVWSAGAPPAAGARARRAHPPPPPAGGRRGWRWSPTTARRVRFAESRAGGRRPGQAAVFYRDDARGRRRLDRGGAGVTSATTPPGRHRDARLQGERVRHGDDRRPAARSGLRRSSRRRAGGRRHRQLVHRHRRAPTPRAAGSRGARGARNPAARVILTGLLRADPAAGGAARSRRSTTSSASTGSTRWSRPRPPPRPRVGPRRGRATAAARRRSTTFGARTFDGQTRAFLKVQEGCDLFCTFCIVPMARGRSRSLPPRAHPRASSRRLAGARLPRGRPHRRPPGGLGTRPRLRRSTSSGCSTRWSSRGGSVASGCRPSTRTR